MRYDKCVFKQKVHSNRVHLSVIRVLFKLCCLCFVLSFKIIERMKIYAKYCNNYDSAEALYKQKIKRKEFESFFNVSTSNASTDLQKIGENRP